jgi:hypothetical protein
MWPTVFLVDAHGVIRARNLRGAPLDETIEKLVREAEKKPAP